MEILNVMEYLMKKTPTVTWREEEFYFSISPFYVCLLSHLFPFILSLISEKGRKTSIWRQGRSNIFSSFSLKRLGKVQKFYPEKVHVKSTCHFLISTVILLIKSIQPTNLCKLNMLVHYMEPAFLGNYKRNAFSFLIQRALQSLCKWP